MSDPTDTQGVPINDDTLQSSDIGDNQSPLQQATAPTQEDARIAAARRFKENEDELGGLRKQYTSYEQQQANAYAEQKRLIDQATQRLTNLPTGPSEQETLYRIAAAASAPVGNFGNAISGINAVKADALAQARAGEMQKQQLLAEYGMKGPDAEIAQTNALMSKNLAEQRVAQSGANSSGNAQFRGQANMPFGLTQAADGSIKIAPGMEAYWNEKALASMYGKGYIKPNPDGSKSWVSLAPQAAALQNAQQPPAATAAAAGAPTPVVRSPPATQPANAAPAPPAASPAAPPAATSPAPPTTAADGHLGDMFQVSNILDPKYGALTDATKPTYVQTAVQAFDPQNFSGYQWHARGFKDPAIYEKNMQTMSSALQTTSDASKQMLYNYGQALNAIDAMGNDKKLLNGPVGEQKAALEQILRGINPELAATVMNDPGFQALSTKQDADKYFRQAALTGLKAIFNGRITNQEMQQRMASLPSTNLLPEVTRLLAQAQAEQAQDMINKQNVFGEYVARGGDPMPARFNQFYDANFYPFVDSRLKVNLDAAKKAPSPQNPMVAYYVAKAKWNAADPKTRGPEPTKPQ